MKIECTRGHNARQCYEGLQEACAERAVPYCTVARWVKAFKEENDPPIILHDNARVHAAGAVTDLLNHSPYYPLRLRSHP